MNLDLVLEILPEKSKKYFDDIRYSRVLGANRHINMIGTILKDTVVSSNTEEEVIKNTKLISDYYKETRGNQSRAVYNALSVMTNNIERIDYTSLDDLKNKIIKKIDSYDYESKENVNKIVEYTNNITKNMNSILVYDYSSTLNEFLINASKKMDIYIPESRALNGGFPFVESAKEFGHKVHFFPDFNSFEVLKKCDAAMIGVESFYPDGTIFNTIGSEIIAILCKERKIPFYALTPLIKVDSRNIQGIKRLSPMEYNFEERIAKDWEENIKSGVDFNGIKLVEIDSGLITAIVTEEGVIPANAMFDISLNYLNGLKEGLHE